jgi:hypothetical protein
MCRLQMLSDCRLEELSSTALDHDCGCGKRLAEPHSERPDGEREQMERHGISVYFSAWEVEGILLYERNCFKASQSGTCYPATEMIGSAALDA